jgi:hypothetical protein
VSKRFQLTARYRKATDALLAIVRERGYGARITHAEMEQATGIGVNDDRWGNMVSRLKARGRREGLVIWCMEAHSYDVLTPDQVLEIVARARTRRARRQCTKAIREVASVPDDRLTPHQRDVKYRTGDHLRAQRKAINRQGRAIEGLKPSSAFGFHPPIPAGGK